MSDYNQIFNKYMKIDHIIKVLPELDEPVATANSAADLHDSAVLMVLHQQHQQWHLLLTTRAAHLNSHAGQISFPGGRFEESDGHLLETAIRETEEEIGLSRKYLQVFSQLEEQSTLTGYRIIPYIAFTEELPKLTIDSGEVDDAFSVPLEYLIETKNQTLESAFYQGETRHYYKINWQDKIIWGATARMIVNLSKHFNQ